MSTSIRNSLPGAVVALVSIAVLSGAMLLVRSHLSVATTALVLVVPVVLGCAMGGFPAGIVAVVGGFFAYDFFFIPPYYTLSVGAAQNWVALLVYVIVMVTVARMVSFLSQARGEARRREDETRRLYVVSDRLITEKSVADLLELVAQTIQQTFTARWVAVLLPSGSRLSVAATAGEDLTAEERALLAPPPGRPQSLGTGTGAGGLVSVALTTNNRPVGLLVMAGATLDPHDRQLLGTFANQAALSIERSQLRDQALRAEVLEEADRWRQALMGAVSHDLRTPLASIKASVSTLRRSGAALDESDEEELLELIENQSDNLARLVTNLLDMTRIESGSLTLRREPISVDELADDALESLGSTVGEGRVRRELPYDLPLVEVDHVLMVQVFANLLDNAARHSPEDAPIVLSASADGDIVRVSVTDCGPGIAPDEREQIFQKFNRVSGSGRAGLGLTIARAFVEAHGQHIEVTDAPSEGARFTFTMPVASLAAELA